MNGGKVFNGFHSFEYLIDANVELKAWVESCNVPFLHFKIAKCIIPKGSTYYNGVFPICDSKGIQVKRAEYYASSQIKYIEIL